MMLDPKSCVDEWVVLLDGAELEPDAEQSPRRPQRFVLGDVRIVVPNKIGADHQSVGRQRQDKERGPGQNKLPLRFGRNSLHARRDRPVALWRPAFVKSAISSVAETEGEGAPIRDALNGELPVARRDGPFATGSPIDHRHCRFVQRDRGANMKGDAVQGVTDCESRRLRRLDHQVFFAMNDHLRVRQIKEVDTRIGVIRRDCFEAQVQTQSIVRGAADNACHEQRRRQEVEIGEFRRIAVIPKNARARTIFQVSPPHVDRKCRRSATHSAWHR